MGWSVDGPSLAEMVAELKESAGVPGRSSSFGWATVDVDRTIRDLGLPDGDPPWEEVEESLLGAIGRRITFGGSMAVVLEPSTEGLLAGWLARNGEGWAVIYADGGPQAGAPDRATTAIDRTGWLERPLTPGLPFVIRVEEKRP
jgi:hypothetical protein